MSILKPQHRVHQTKPAQEEGWTWLEHVQGQFLNAQPLPKGRDGAKGFDVQKPGGNKRGY